MMLNVQLHTRLSARYNHINKSANIKIKYVTPFISITRHLCHLDILVDNALSMLVFHYSLQLNVFDCLLLKPKGQGEKNELAPLYCLTPLGYAPDGLWGIGLANSFFAAPMNR
jgi:hypothetical protein